MQHHPSSKFLSRRRNAAADDPGPDKDMVPDEFLDDLPQSSNTQQPNTQQPNTQQQHVVVQPHFPELFNFLAALKSLAEESESFKRVVGIGRTGIRRWQAVRGKQDLLATYSVEAKQSNSMNHAIGQRGDESKQTELLNGFFFRNDLRSGLPMDHAYLNLAERGVWDACAALAILRQADGVSHLDKAELKDARDRVVTLELPKSATKVARCRHAQTVRVKSWHHATRYHKT
ncbi:hypothetical protein DEU56DRAFT_897906 [Suillus clintonianus]|uniref:uncharacterized protein n=1 Tax=Suillus clintonianus TaxID=1904413 RepID=UPI001B87ABD0|nr:uncharacterized protein DEU56DRAFT_897906 [Suillus clintonianus]KAG2153836.1 hypothetical protein DEU56DRAFT_897906 [Suillus clintonianus]